MKRWGKSPPASRETGTARQTPPGARPDRNAGGPPIEFRVGRTEVGGDAGPRWMDAAVSALPRPAQNPAYRRTRYAIWPRDRSCSVFRTLRYRRPVCGRYVLAAEADDYAEYFAVDRVVSEALDASYNVAPTDSVYTIAEWEGERLLGSMAWGFVPHWAKDRKSIQINARSETVATKPMFRDSLARKRCIIPADGFYEWEPKDRGRTPHWIHRADGYPMAFAGIWSSWKDPATEQWIRTCSIITTQAAGDIADIHSRMPVSLVPEVWDRWLDRGLTDLAAIEGLIQPIDPDLLMEYPVDSRVNSVRNNGPELVEPV